MRSRKAALGAAGVLVLALAALDLPAAISTPVATSEATYQLNGRVWPDPHGCTQGAPGTSPFAKGNVCAADFMQLSELVGGLDFLEQLFPRFVEVYRLDEDFDCNGRPVAEPSQGCNAFRSAGLAQTATTDGALTRARQPLMMVRVTDESVPARDKKFFVFPLSIHGIERAGVEGGTRAAEDLATWGACEAGTAPDIVDCAADENKAPHPLLEATPKTSLTAGHVLERAAVYFIYPNPDGWMRGDRTTGTQFYQRYNGNGVDLNRDWPEQGFTFRPYTPWSEPETAGFGKVLQAIGPKDKSGNPKWAGGIDLHGQLIDRAFSFTLIGGAERPYDKNQRVLQTVKGAWRDAEKRLAWSPLIKPNDAPQEDPRVYGVQWGTVWDTIDYTVTGALGDWIDSPIGLNADGIDNEMSLSHVSNCGIGSCWDPGIEQLHVDGNKSLVYSMLNFSLKPENNSFETEGRVGYLFNPGVVEAEDSLLTRPPAFAALDPQKDVEGLMLDPSNDYAQPFSVKGPKDGVYNGGIEATITCANAGGVGPCALSEARLERKSTGEPNTQGEEWETVNTYFNQSPIYVQAGQALHANLPEPGRYRIRVIDGGVGGVYRADVDFSREKAWPDPGQIGYRATNMRFWQDLEPFADPGLDKLTASEIKSSTAWQTRFNTIVVTNAIHRDLAGRLRDWVDRFDGNLVLTDRALGMLPEMGLVEGGIDSTKVYAGYVNFATLEREATYDDPLARNINQDGAAEGGAPGAGDPPPSAEDEIHRRQTYEPVPLGMAIQTPDGGDDFNAPVWFVDAARLDKSAGEARAVGTTTRRSRVSFGEIKYRGGRIRFIGALLPMPTDDFDHPFGLADYGLTYSGYQLLQNVLTWRR